MTEPKILCRVCGMPRHKYHPFITSVTDSQNRCIECGGPEDSFLHHRFMGDGPYGQTPFPGEETMALRKDGENTRPTTPRPPDPAPQPVSQSYCHTNPPPETDMPEAFTRKAEPADFAIEVLNRALWEDPEAINALFKVRVPCNEALANDNDIQVRGHEDGTNSVSILGLINGIFGAREDRWGKVCILVGDKGIERFERTPKKPHGD